jgi:zinc D-Ala-D-Ala carboxypeptidase
MVDWDSVRYFKAHEFACRCGCGIEGIQPGLVYELDNLRHAFGKPIRINSGFRCPDWNDSESSTGRTGPHTTGLAADLGVAGRDAFVILKLAQQMKFTGIGINQKGVYTDRFVHLDMIPDSLAHKRPWIWTY